MKTLRLSSIFTVICLFFSACSSSDDGSDPLPLPPDPVIAVGDDIAQFDVNFNMEPRTESEIIPSSSADAFYADYFEHKTFSKPISVVFDGDIATMLSTALAGEDVIDPITGEVILMAEE